MAEWFICLKDGHFHKMSDWEQAILEQTAGEGKNVIEYHYPRKGPDGEETTWKYEIDMVAMTQTNTQFGTVRRLLRLKDSSSHTMTSPFRPS